MASLSTDRPGKLATPATAATVVVPDSTAPAAPVPAVIANVTLPVKLDAVCPEASRAVTTIDGASAAPAVAGSGGCTVKNSCVPTDAMMLNGTLVAPVSPAALADTA